MDSPSLHSHTRQVVRALDKPQSIVGEARLPVMLLVRDCMDLEDFYVACIMQILSLDLKEPLADLGLFKNKSKFVSVFRIEHRYELPSHYLCRAVSDSDLDMAVCSSLKRLVSNSVSRVVVRAHDHVVRVIKG
jgi:hypothetical protein